MLEENVSLEIHLVVEHGRTGFARDGHLVRMSHGRVDIQIVLELEGRGTLPTRERPRNGVLPEHVFLEDVLVFERAGAFRASERPIVGVLHQ